jgi:hypothetical protein
MLRASEFTSNTILNTSILTTSVEVSFANAGGVYLLAE